MTSILIDSFSHNGFSDDALKWASLSLSLYEKKRALTKIENLILSRKKKQKNFFLPFYIGRETKMSLFETKQKVNKILSYDHGKNYAIN
jgi:hypothetical protein